jgi:RNA-directed DNA polymerase
MKEQSLELTNQTGRSSRPPRPECCSEEGKAKVPVWGPATEQLLRSVHKEKHGPQERVASLLSNPAPKPLNADGDGVLLSESYVKETGKGEVSDNPPGSKSVARVQSDDRNLGGPDLSRRTNYGSQAGRGDQRQEDRPEVNLGVRSAHSNWQQGPQGLETREGADHPTQPSKETGAVRTTEPSWQTSLKAIANKAKQEPGHRFGGLYRMLNEENLEASFKSLRKQAAPGVDGVTVKDYARDLKPNLKELVRELKNKSYHAKLVKRKYIPKPGGKLRPLGLPVLEDKLLQGASSQILSAIYEADFLPCSYAYRPDRSAWDAVRELTESLALGKFEFVVEADIQGFFTHLQHSWVMRMLEQRVQDGALLGLINKWLRAGILEESGQVEWPEGGTPQGGSISPVLANIYLHYALDLWFERVVRKACQGRCKLFRYADDFVCVFERRHEAEQFYGDLKERLRKFGLETAPEKTQMLRFGRGGGEHNGRFEFLGFEYRWEKSRLGKPIIKRRTAPKKLRAAVAKMTEWIKEQRSCPIREIMHTLRQKFTGHWNYYGVIGNAASLGQYENQATRIVKKWLNRRSQKKSYTWRQFQRLLERFEIPRPRIREKVKQVKALALSWTKEHLERIKSVNLFGDSYRPC